MVWLWLFESIAFWVTVWIAMGEVRRVVRRVCLYRCRESLEEIVERSKKMAYAKVFREDIAMETLNGTRVNRDEMVPLVKKYTDLMFTYGGPRVIDDLVELHGSLESVCAGWASEFVARVLEDEIQIFARNGNHIIGERGLDVYLSPDKEGMIHGR